MSRTTRWRRLEVTSSRALFGRASAPPWSSERSARSIAHPVEAEIVEEYREGPVGGGEQPE